MILLTETGPTVRIDAPGVVRRIVMAMCDYNSAVAGEVLLLTFQPLTMMGGLTGASIAASGQAVWTLGGTTSVPHLVSTTVATGVANYLSDAAVAGALPDLWWGPDLVVSMGLASLGGALAANWILLIEETEDTDRR